MPVRIESEGEIGIITIDNPPVNALAQPVRTAFLTAMGALEFDLSIRAIVLHGVGRNFIAGADIREFDGAPQLPALSDILLRLEALPKPIVAALHGATLGGGAEVALASHYRCASEDLSFGFPEIKLGLLPGAGGTVRLPRFVGVKTALDMMLSGEPISAVRALELGLLDRVGHGDVRSEAISYARELIGSGAIIRRSRHRPIADTELATARFFANYRASLSPAARRLPASEHIVRCVEAASFEAFAPALAQARISFEQCRTSSESAALRHLFLAERGAGNVFGEPRNVHRVGVIGSGTMGSGIACSFAQAGFATVLHDDNPTALAAGLDRLRSILDAAAKKGRMSHEAAEAAKDRVSGELSLDALADADLVVEAIVENLTAKQDLFRRLGELCKPGAVLATNTSTLDVDAISASSGRPADVLGMHFFSPAHIMRLVEIVRARESSPEALATALAVSKRLNKIGIVVGNTFGFVGNRMLYAYGREKERMLLEGVSPERLDQALETFGMAMGPNAVGDLAGLDVGVSARRAWKDRPADPGYYRVSDLLVEHGRLGQKNGRGFYRYDGHEKRRAPDPEVTALISAEARRLNVRQREIADDDIVARCVFALVNEGARMLAEGIAKRAADIDVIWCNGYGFPRWRGGPMFHADTVGLKSIVAEIERNGEIYGTRDWNPAPLLSELARSNDRFTEWDRKRSVR